MAKAKSVAEVRDSFSEQVIDSIETFGKQCFEATTAGKQRKQFPVKVADDGWDGDLTNLVDMSKPFSREEIEDDFQAAITDPQAPGTVGDLMVVGLQGDYLASMERAFRARHQSRARAIMHASARCRGHGSPAGVIRRGISGYVEGLVKLSKDGAKQ